MKEKQLLKSSPHIQFGPETQVAHSKPTFYECCITYTGSEWATCWTKLDVGGGYNCFLGGVRTRWIKLCFDIFYFSLCFFLLRTGRRSGRTAPKYFKSLSTVNSSNFSCITFDNSDGFISSFDAHHLCSLPLASIWLPISLAISALKPAIRLSIMPLMLLSCSFTTPLLISSMYIFVNPRS